MVSAAARSPLPITKIARAHTRPELNFSSGFVRCASVYLCIARNRISRRWRAIPAACNLTLPRPPNATISYNLLPSYPKYLINFTNTFCHLEKYILQWSLTLPRPHTISFPLILCLLIFLTLLEILRKDLSNLYTMTSSECGRLAKSKLARFVYFECFGRFLTITQWSIYQIYPSTHQNKVYSAAN